MGRAPSRGHALLASIACAASLCGTGRTRAGEPPPTRWVYEAPHACPSPAELERALRARIPVTALERDRRTFVIQIAQRNGSFVGRLTFSDDVGERVVEERTCEAVVEALVVFTAIALDPSHMPAEARDDLAAPPPAPDPPAPEAPAPEPPAPEPRRSPPSPPPTRRAESPNERSRGRLPAMLGFGAGAGVTSGPVPGLAPVFTLGIGLHQPFSAERGIAVRVGMKAAHGEKEVSTGRLDAYLVAGQLDVAPTFTWRSLSIAAGPALTLGALSATGQDISAARHSNAFWADVGARLRAGVRAGALRFEAYADGAAALTPRTYMVRRPVGEREVHATPPLLVTVGGELVIELGQGL